jgi:hypothetical protein
MLRASKTLQPENDTRRLRPVSMNGENLYWVRLQMQVSAAVDFAT